MYCFLRNRLLELAWRQPLETGDEAAEECGHGLWILRTDVAHLSRERPVQISLRNHAGDVGHTLRSLESRRATTSGD